VNDRLDVALAAGAHGVQLKEASIPPLEARRIAPPGFLIGCSVHSVAAIAARKGADFFIAGTVRPTASKPRVDYLDEVGLKAIVGAAEGQPVIGIGGLNERSIPLLAAAGAAGMAAVGAFVPDEGDEIRAGVKKRVTALRFALESMRRST
jgi:thiamine-phosphate pyrophosphorylase